MTIAFVFPGQGSQAVGMGAALAEAYPRAREIFEEIDDTLSQPLSRLMREGPDDQLTLTENAQPALMAVSLAVVRVIEALTGKNISDHCQFVAGHSLGEYSALAAVRALSLADTARLLKLRGQAMQAAVPVGVGAMAALLGLDYPAVAAIAQTAAKAEDGTMQIVAAANDNAPGQVVVSGHKAAVDRAITLAQAEGAKRAMLLPVSAPFHCGLMAPAADRMAEALAQVEIAPPAVPVVVNVLAQPVVDPNALRRHLVEQVCGRVRWRESMLCLQEQGVDRIVELGSGKVLSGLAKRIHPELTGISVNDPASLEAFLASL